MSVMPTYMLISFFGRSECSTSALTRRSKNGRRTLCSCLTTESSADSSLAPPAADVDATGAADSMSSSVTIGTSSASSSAAALVSAVAVASPSSSTVAVAAVPPPLRVSNQRSKSAMLEKTSGRRKLSSAQSSCRLFCSGVPVMSSRPRDSNRRTIWERIESTFLIRCASSMMMYSHASRLSGFFSRWQISYDVMQTSKSCVRIVPLIRSLRSSGVPRRMTVLKPGTQCSNSRCQLSSVDLGTTTRCGPAMSRCVLR